ncbi:N-acetylglucosamine kinase [Clostridium tarantellae]|uniref:ATPase n=1 Tax=Clostridium tarantellae TaxID=39493 RepID=A0A6I1MHL8_9CLOT|nr:BadF/BadG/BcrA/BcrD ATPase family protein [Clostridium tarantellae]MPQ42640.1 ATPase [Clostridium tarantellae]
MYYLGVDGGGTKTSFMLINQLGEIKGFTNSSTCHIHQVGFQGLKEVIENGIKEVCSQGGITKNDLSYSFLGLPAYGENADEEKKILKTIDEIFGTNKASCGNDISVALAGSLASKSGICIILGTGAIAAGLNENFQTCRTSGWGHICGDEGSGYWIAKKGIEIFSKEADNRLEKTPLYYIFRENLNLKNDFDLIFLIKDKYKQDRTKIAKLALLVYEAAKQGDKHALEIYKQAAYECFLMVKGIIKQLDLKYPLNVSYAGSVFNSGELIINPLKDYLGEISSQIYVQAPILTPIKGAALNAIKLHTGIINDTIINTLANENAIDIKEKIAVLL